MLSQRENSPATEHKGMEYYDLTDKEFKISIKKKFNKLQENSKRQFRASLVVQWLRICLLMQGTRVRALVWEDPTCRGATRPVSHNY